MSQSAIVCILLEYILQKAQRAQCSSSGSHVAVTRPGHFMHRTEKGVLTHTHSSEPMPRTCNLQCPPPLHPIKVAMNFLHMGQIQKQVPVWKGPRAWQWENWHGAMSVAWCYCDMVLWVWHGVMSMAWYWVWHGVMWHGVMSVAWCGTCSKWPMLEHCISIKQINTTVLE